MYRNRTYFAWFLGACCAAALLGALPAQAQLFVAYHDLGAITGSESTGNITTHQSGASGNSTVALDTTTKQLINYFNGAMTGVGFSISGANAMDARPGVTLPPAAGTPAAALFNVPGLNLTNGMIYEGGNGFSGSTTFTFTGLNPGLRYDLALYGDRTLTADGVERFTLNSADSATNVSSTGIVNAFTADMETRPNNTLGHIVRWVDIAPGLDGTFTVDINPEISSADNLAYLTGLRLAATPEPTSIVVWSLLGLGLVGFGYFHVRRRK